MSRNADSKGLGYVRQFTIVPGVVIEKRIHRLGGNGTAMLLIVLHLAAKHRSDHALVSHRTLQELTGWSINRIRDAKRELCDAIPEAFTLVPGDAATRRPDAIRFDRAALEALHHAHLREAGHRTEEAPVPLSETDPGLYPKQTETSIRNGSNKKSTYKTEKDSSSQLASLAGEAENQNITFSEPEGRKRRQHQEEEVAAKKPAARRASLGDADAQRFVDAWNAGRHARFASKRVLAPAEHRSLEALVKAHGGDVEAGLETWTLAVAEVARLGADSSALFWGDTSRRPAPTMANLLPHWGKHADAARSRRDAENRPAPQPQARVYVPAEVI